MIYLLIQKIKSRLIFNEVTLLSTVINELSAHPPVAESNAVMLMMTLCGVFNTHSFYLFKKILTAPTFPCSEVFYIWFNSSWSHRDRFWVEYDIERTTLICSSLVVTVCSPPSLKEQLADLYQAIHSSANMTLLQQYEEVIHSLVNQSLDNRLECEKLETSLKRWEQMLRFACAGSV